MRFIHAWANIASQNVSLKFGVVFLSITAVSLGIGVTNLALRPPLIIDRACVSSVINPGSTQYSAVELDAFTRSALSQRFNSGTDGGTNYLSVAEIKFREQEQQEFKRREMTQKIIINSVKIDGNVAVVDSDRLIAIGKIKSVLPFLLTVSLSHASRTQENPYGLLLEKTTPTMSPEEKLK